MEIPNYLTTKQFCAKHQAFAIGGIKELLSEQYTNGLFESKAIVRIGRKLLIDEQMFFEWVKSQNGAEK